MSDANKPWLLRVLRAFRAEMNAGRIAGVPEVLIGWPHPAMNEGRMAPFVWFAADPVEVVDGREIHRGTEIVTGIVFRSDGSNRDESELEQAIAAYYAMRAQLGLAIENDTSGFNAAFEGLAQPDAEKGGIQPTGANDFDGTSVIGERWLVQGTAALVGQPNA
jgi:hypothetical protein